MTKGRLVGITGALRQETWTTGAADETRERVVVIAYAVDFLPDRKARNTEPATDADAREVVTDSPAGPDQAP